MILARGAAYRETDEAKCDQQSVIDDFLTGQFNNPVRVVAFNTAEGWSRDASEDIADLKLMPLANAAKFSRRLLGASTNVIRAKRRPQNSFETSLQ